MSYSYRKQHQQYDDLPVTNPGEDRQPVYRREDVDGEPRLVVDHWISQQELIESDRPIDVQDIVKRALRGDPSVLGYGSDADFEEKWKNANFGDVSGFGDINDLYDSAMAFKIAASQFSNTEQVDQPVQNVESEVKLDES